MALIYEIIDTQGKIVPDDWKRLINFSLRNLDSISLIKNFLSSDNYIYSHPDNIKSKIIEKILDDSNLQETINNRKQFWINTRIDRFGKNCFIERKDSIAINNESNIISNPSINNSDIQKESIETQNPKIEDNNPIENNNDISEIIPSSSIDSSTTNPQFKDTNEELSQEEISKIDNIISSEENLNNEEIEKESEPNFNNTEFKFNDIIYNGLDDLMNNIDSDISREIIIKTLTGKINKNYKKKYKDILSKLFIFKDNEWDCII